MSDHSRIEWDRRDLESDSGLFQDQPRLCPLLCRDVCRAVSRVKGHPYEQGFDLRLVPSKRTDPLRWQTPRMVFVNSMSDLFHQDVLEDYIKDVVRVMLLADWQTYQILTRRSTRMCGMLRTTLRDAAGAPQIWWGVSVENRRDSLPRVTELRAAPVGTRVLSVEPLLEDLGPFDLTGIHSVILGGEGGPGARPLNKDWVIAIRDKCKRSGVPFLFKQWGGTCKGKTGCILEGQTYYELPLRVVRSGR